MPPSFSWGVVFFFLHLLKVRWQSVRKRVWDGLCVQQTTPSSNLLTLHHTLQIWPLSVKSHYFWSLFSLSAIFSLFPIPHYPINKHYQKLDCKGVVNSQLTVVLGGFWLPTTYYILLQYHPIYNSQITIPHSHSSASLQPSYPLPPSLSLSLLKVVKSLSFGGVTRTPTWKHHQRNSLWVPKSTPTLSKGKEPKG